MDAGLVTCPSCGQPGQRGKRFCGDCGAPLPASCPSCGAANPPGKRFCGDCGRPLVGDAPTASSPVAATSAATPSILPQPTGSALPATPPPAGETELERRLATILFADLVDSTRLGETLDPEDVHALFEAAQAALAETVTQVGGHVAQYLGDGLLALFGAPTAHEDDAERAVLAGLQMPRALAAVNDTRPHGLPVLRLRVGIATGEVVTGTMGNAYGVRGDAANTAARLQGAAEPGGVLVDAATMELAKRRVRFGDRLEFQLKGKADAVTAYPALAARETLVERWEVREQRTPLIGREEELGRLTAAWRRTQQGEGQLITVIGEAGVGKSRLVAEALERITATGEVRVLRARALSYGQQMSLWLVADLLRALCGLHERDTLEEVRTRLRATMAALLARHDAEMRASAADVLGEVLGLPAGHSAVANAGAQARRHWVIRGLRLLLGALSARTPVVLALEDLHWLDEGSAEVLAAALTDVPGLRVLVLASQRPDWSAPWNDWGWAERLTLRTLGVEDGTRLAEAVLGGVPLAPELERHVAERAAGNPFFVEELVRALQEAGELLTHEGQVALAPGAAERLPATLTEVLLARLDRLEAEVRSLAQVASVLGRTFAVRLLAHVVGQDARLLEPPLGVLQRAEIVFPRPSVDPEYIFKHATLREVAYNTLVQRRRQALHLTAARAIAALYPAEEYVEIIAYHYGKTEEHGEAAPWLERAGDYAAGIYANAVAIGHYEEARRRRVLIGADELTLARLDEKRGTVLSTAGRFDAALEVLERVAATWQDARDLDGMARVAAQIGWTHGWRGTAEEGIARLQPVLDTLSQCGPSSRLAELYTVFNYLYWSISLYSESLAAGEHAAEVARAIGDERLVARAEAMTANVLTMLGQFGEALRKAEDVIPPLRADHDWVHLTAALVSVGWVQAIRGEFDRSEASLTHLYDLHERLGEPAFIAFSLALRAWVLFMSGDWSRVRVDMERAIALLHPVVASFWFPYPLIELGRLCLAEGDLPAAESYLQEASTRAERHGDLQALRWAATRLAERDVLEGRPEAAIARLVPLHDRPGLEESDVTFFLPVLAWAYLEAGDVGQAVDVVAQAIARMRPENVRAHLVDALRVQAMVAIQQARWAEATSALEEGLTLARAMPYPYAEGRLLHVYGQMHGEKDEPEQAQERLDAALAIFQQLGARKDVERVEKAMALLRQP